MIIVDVHEPDDLKALADEVRELPVDYIVVGSERKYIIERKEVMDLWSSVKDGRLWRQLLYLEKAKEEENYIPILLVEGYLTKLLKFATSMTPIKLMGLQLAFSSFGVSVVQVKEGWSKLFLKFLNKKAGQKRRYSRPNIPKPVERSIVEERIDMLRAVSGVGDKTAEALLGKFGRIIDIVNAGDAELREVLKSKADHFIEVVRGG
jgi:ERCC4-type nuclease